MAADVPVNPEVENSCCAEWKQKCAKLEKGRNALRKCVKVQEQQIDKVLEDNSNLKKAYEEVCKRADVEKEERVKESAARVSLENEISGLKSEICSLKQRGNAGAQDKSELNLLKAHVSDSEKEINRLKELIEIEKKRADSESKKAEVEKRKASEAQKSVKAEKSKADEEKKRANIERDKAENYRLQLEVLKKEADKAKSDLASVTLKLEVGNKNLEVVKKKLEVANKKLEVEKQKVVKERERASSEMTKAEEQWKLAEANRKKRMEETESLPLKLMESKKRIEELQKEVNEIRSSRELHEPPGCQPDNNRKATTSEQILMSEADVLKLVSEHPHFEEANKRCEIEKQKAIQENRRADSEMAKTEKQKKLVEVNWKKAMEEKSRADNLYRQLDEAKKQIEELSSRKLNEASAVELGKDKGDESDKVKHLKKQLKFEKMQRKHAKEVVKLERSRGSILQQELGRLQLEFNLFSQRLDMLNKGFSHSAEGIDDPVKMSLQSGRLLKPSCPASDPFREAMQHTTTFLPLSGENCTESISGIDSILESQIRDSNRKMLQCSALNSSTASFSDRPLVGSQEKGAFSVTTSEKLVEEIVQPTISNLSAEVTKIDRNQNVAVVAENNVRNTFRTDGVGRVNEHSKKRKRIFDAVESIENLYFEGKKLHLQVDEKLSVLHCLLNKKEKPFEEGRYLLHSLQGNSYAKHERLYEKGKEGLEQKGNKFENEVCGCAIVCRQVSENANELIGAAQVNSEGINNSVTSDFEIMARFEEVTDGNYLRLLELDNAADEECYRMAMERPLSPTIPEIEVQGVEASDADNIKPLIMETCLEGLSNKEEKESPCYSFDVINVEMNLNNLNFDDSGHFNNSLLHKNGGHADSFDILGKNGNGSSNSISTRKACDLPVHVSGAEVMSNAPISRNDKAMYSFGSELGYAGDNILKGYVVFSNINDSSSISRIYYASKTCITQCSLATQTDWIAQEILLALKTREELLPKEKVCVFFSLLLLNFSTAALSKFGSLNWNSNPCLDSFSQHMCSVMSDGEGRSMFAEFGCLDGSLSLIEDFLMNGRVVVSDASGDCHSRVNSVFDGVHISSRPASADELVAGSIVLASICAALDHIGFICETSYNILQISRFSHSLVLTFLHVFAYLGGEKFFNSGNYNLVTLMKSIVTYLEGTLSDSAGSGIPSVSNAQTVFCPCDKCPFSENAVSIEVATSLVLERLQINSLSAANVMESGNSNSNSCVLFNKFEVQQIANPDNCGLDVQCDVSCSLNKFAMPGIQSNSCTGFTICDLSDLLSLVELVAIYMGWEWTSAKVVPRILTVLESCKAESVIAGIIVLLGQLGRLGVNAVGYEDKGVELLRCELSTFLCRDSTISVGLPTQIAMVTALLDLVSFDFETIIQSTEEPAAIATQSGPAQSIRKWFSLLPRKQQDSISGFLQTAGVNMTCETGRI